MAEQSGKPANGVESADSPTLGSLLSDFIWMASGFWASPQRNRLLTLAGALIAVVGASAYMQMKLNAWNRPFYNALTHKDMPAFLEQLGIFAKLAGILLVLNVAQMWLNQTCKVVLRQGLVNDLLNEWLKPVRAFRLSNSGAIGANPDQRLQADAQHLTDLSTDLGIGLLQSSLLLLTFVGVLWGLSQGEFLPFAGRDFAPPGYLVWCALFYAGAASFLSWRVGSPLVNLNAEHYAREADFRFALVRVNEELEGITLYGGEADERQRLGAVFETVLEVSRRIVGVVTQLTWVTAGYGWLAIVAPILVAAPAYLQSGMSFGELMVVVGAFNQVQSSLRWFVDNFSNIADWRATLFRVAAFRKALITTGEPSGFGGRITYAEGDAGTIRIDDLAIVSSSNADQLKEPKVILRAGDRAHILGAPGVDKTQLFRALAGLWPWGAGQVTRPKGEQIFYLPRGTPYMPRGTLREVLAYPLKADGFSTAGFTRALYRLGLERLAPLLDETRRWDRELSQDEQLCLAFARLLIQKPPWVLIDGTFGSLDDDVLELVIDVFTNELQHTGVIHIGGPGEAHVLFSS